MAVRFLFPLSIASVASWAIRLIVVLLLICTTITQSSDAENVVVDKKQRLGGDLTFPQSQILEQKKVAGDVQMKQQHQQQNYHPPSDMHLRTYPDRPRGPLIQPIIGMNFYTNYSYFYDLIPEGTKLLTKEEISVINQEYPDMTAIIHIGPMKTGSSAIQASFRHTLRQDDITNDSDNYIDIESYIARRVGHWNNMAAFVMGCFRDPTTPTFGFIECKPELLPMTHESASIDHHNIIFSGEYLIQFQTHIPAFKEFLSPWKHHRVVVYYRRYYSWMISLHNQYVKELTTPERQTLYDFLLQELKFQNKWKNAYIVTGIDRWKQVFDDIVVINQYECPDGGDVRDCFYCKALMNATKLCQRFRNDNQLSNGTARPANPSVALVYEDLAYEAMQMNLWSSEKIGTIREVSHHVKHYQERVLNLTQYDFGIAKECPPENVSQYLLQQTLDTEQLLFPEYFIQTGEQQIRTEFDTYQQTKLCHMNAVTILQQDNINGTMWKNFFTQILPNITMRN